MNKMILALSLVFGANVFAQSVILDAQRVVLNEKELILNFEERGKELSHEQIVADLYLAKELISTYGMAICYNSELWSKSKKEEFRNNVLKILK